MLNAASGVDRNVTQRVLRVRFLVCLEWFGLAGWRAHIGLLTLPVSFTLFAGQQRVTRVAPTGCHSVGVAAAEELGLEVKLVCWLAGFEVIST